MQDKSYDVQPGSAVRREDWPLQSSCWQHLPAPPPQHRACSTSHPPQRGAIAHLSHVSPHRHCFSSSDCNRYLPNLVFSIVLTNFLHSLIHDSTCCVFQWDKKQPELESPITSFPVYNPAAATASVSVQHLAGPHCVCGRDHRVHSKSKSRENNTDIGVVGCKDRWPIWTGFG